MPQSKPPVQLPKKALVLPVEAEVEEPLKCSSSPWSPTKSPKNNLGNSTPPPALPKPWLIRASSADNENVMAIAKSKPPVQLPKKALVLPVEAEVEEPLKCSSSPWSPTKSPKNNLGNSTPPPALPKPWLIRASSADNENVMAIAKSKPPVPFPKKALVLPVEAKVEEPLKCSSSPWSPTKSPKNNLGNSTPPPALPKPWLIRASSADNENVMAIAKKLDQTFKDQHNGQPPLLSPTKFKPPKMLPDDEDKTPYVKKVSACYKDTETWKTLSRDLQLQGKSNEKILEIEAKLLGRAFKFYTSLMFKHQGKLEENIEELGSIADNLDKVSKGTKIAGITGGATTVAGGVAAAAGVILSPFTLGASLALTAVGVGVAAAGGVTGASAAIANKVSSTQEQKKIEKAFLDYKSNSEDILACLRFISEGIEQIKKHGQSVLEKPEKVKKMLQLFAQEGASANALEANSKSSGLIEGFALGMDFYFTQGKDGPKVKKGFESKLAKKIRTLKEELQSGLDELIKLNDLINEHFP